MLFKNEPIWPKSKCEGSQLGVSYYHLHPTEGCGLVVGEAHWLLSASQKWIILQEQQTDPGLCQSCRAVFLWLAASDLLCYCPVPQLRFLTQIKQQWWWIKKWQQCWKKMPLRFTFAWWARRTCRVLWGWKWQCSALLWHEMHSLPSVMTKVGAGLCSRPVACGIGLKR